MPHFLPSVQYARLLSLYYTFQWSKGNGEREREREREREWEREREREGRERERRKRESAKERAMIQSITSQWCCSEQVHLLIYSAHA